VDFQADDGLVLREHFGREGRFLWSGFAMGTKIIASGGRLDRFAKRGEEAFGKSEAGEEQGAGAYRASRHECSRKRGCGNGSRPKRPVAGVVDSAEELPDGENW